GWADAFRARCQASGWLDETRLPQQLAAWLRARRFSAPAKILFSGFDEWTPQQQAFLQALREAGCTVAALTTPAAAPVSARRVSCGDADEEMRSAARWARAILETDPQANIGIVVQDLNACRDRFARILDDVLCPPALMHGKVARPYNLSLGRPLASYPLINDALQMLQIGQRQLRFSTASLLLRSPFLAAAGEEQYARAQLEFSLREHSGATLPLTQLLGLARAQGNVPGLVRRLEAALKSIDALPSRQPVGAWVRTFGQWLDLLGWPGTRTPDSDEYQTLQKFREACSQLVRLDALLGNIEYGEALTRLANLLVQQSFQPAGQEVPVQVLGMLEATGLRFDYLWILGLSDDKWPASPRPNPFIPIAIQRARSLPHASAARELEFARTVTGRLLASAPMVVTSAPQRADDQLLRPSPLIAAVPCVELTQLPQYAHPACAAYLYSVAPPLQDFADAQGPPLPPGPMAGGTGILKSQAACPFQAFASYRLGAKPLTLPAPGLDPAERGALLHTVLERLWRQLGDQARLQALDQTARAALVAQVLEETLRKARLRQPQVFTPRFMALEQERLARVLLEWLGVEAARAPFTVEAREVDREARIGPLTFNTRVDRVDRLAAGGSAIIDYKSGDAKLSAWSGERPDEPQLPCYAVVNREQLQAVLFAVLRPGECGYRGYTRETGVVPGVDAYTQLQSPMDGCGDWSGLLAHWQVVLEGLSSGFASGRAEVAPKKRGSTCRFCHLAALCRIHELEGAPVEDGEDAP
ncbi:MAG: PD-(D/E)XK nuclease family protein, partial [Gammaproteobacteria bacterium]|nr:PD-(D/E)XK nuclease family protein [Gammaproteobacteria bacterium]